MFPCSLGETAVQPPERRNLSSAAQNAIPSPRVSLSRYPYSRGLNRVSPLLCNTVAPLGELVDGPFEFVVRMPENSPSAARRVEIPFWVRGSRWGPTSVERIRWRCDEEHAWLVYSKYNGGDLEEDVICQMLNAVHTPRDDRQLARIAI